MRYLIWLPVLVLVSSCSYMPDWMGSSSDDEKRLSGERYSYLAERQVLKADPEVKGMVIQLPAPEKNGAWFQGQAVAQDGASLVRHVALRGDLKEQDSYSDGSAPDEDVRLTSTPVIIGNLLVTLDGQGAISALNLNDLDTEVWNVDLKKLAVEAASASGRESGWLDWFGGDEDFIGGNITFVEGRIIATTGNGHVFAFDVTDGKLLWHRAMGIAIQSAPSGRNGNVYFVTSDNELYALSLKDGVTQWSFKGVPQQTTILGAPAPVALADLVIVPFSSGQLVALKTVNGFKLWEVNLDEAFHASALGYQFTDIVASPVAYGGRVFASADGHLISVDIMTGNRMWDIPVTLSSTPWMAGEWLFGVTNQEELIAVHATDGKVRWVAALPRYGHPDKKKDRISWSGPVLANGMLIVNGSRGEIRRYNVESGEMKDAVEVPENVLLPPIVANGKLFLLDNDSDLSVLE